VIFSAPSCHSESNEGSLSRSLEISVSLGGIELFVVNKTNNATET